MNKNLYLYTNFCRGPYVCLYRSAETLWKDFNSVTTKNIQKLGKHGYSG